MQPLRSALFANGGELYEISDQWEASVTGGGAVPAFSGDYEYFGYLNILGKWIIQRHQISTGQYRYVNGPNSFSTNFALAIAGSLTGYDYYNKMLNTVP